MPIVSVALSQVGITGGELYWNWYGFAAHVDWCACFVSRCANECGYMDNGIIPKYAGCVNGVSRFKDRGQWLDGTVEPILFSLIGQPVVVDFNQVVDHLANGVYI